MWGHLAWMMPQASSVVPKLDQHVDHDGDDRDDDPHRLKAPRPADPRALAPYVDDDHHATAGHPQVADHIIDAKASAIGTHLAVLSMNMTEGSGRAFLQQLDQLDDPALRAKVLARFEQTTGRSMASFIEESDGWNNTGDKRDKHAALQLVSDERGKAEATIAKMDPRVRAQKEKEANDRAIQILSATTAHEGDDATVQKVFRALGPCDPVDIELLRAAIRRHTDGQSNLYQALDDGMKKGDEDAAITMLAGDRVGSARAALANETDPKRLREIITGLAPSELALLRTGPFVEIALAQIPNLADRAEMRALIAGDRALGDAERLGNLLRPKTEGLDLQDEASKENTKRRKSGNVLAELEALSGEEVKAAAAAWNQAHPMEPFEAMIVRRWGGDSDPTECQRLLAMVSGDKGLARSLRLQAGLRDGDQEEIEGALAHRTVTDEDLASPDPAIRKRAEAIRAENDSFERNNRDADRRAKQGQRLLSYQLDVKDVTGASTKDQLVAHYDARAAETVGVADQLRAGGENFASQMQAKQQKKHDEKVLTDRVGAMELLADGKLSTETEFHRGKGDKEKAAALESFTSNQELEAAKERHWKKYGTIMLPIAEKADRANMSGSELEIDNVRRYGVKAERPAQLEYLLQLQQYEQQYSSSLERSEMAKAGGGTQAWQRQELSALRKMLATPQHQAFAPHLETDEDGRSNLVRDPREMSAEEIEARLPSTADGVHDGLADGVSKQAFVQQDKGMSAANTAQSEAKKRRAAMIAKVFATLAKIAAVLTANPWLIGLIDLGAGLLDIAIKKQEMGTDYDASEDAKMLGWTMAADMALLGVAKVGALKSQRALVAGTEAGVTSRAAIEASSRLQEGYKLLSQITKSTVQTVGQGVVQDKSATDILRAVIASGLALALPEKLGAKVKAAIGDEETARKVVGEIAAYLTESTSSLAGNMVATDDGLGSFIDSFGGAVGSRLQKRYPWAKRKEAAKTAALARADEHAARSANDNAVRPGPTATPAPDALAPAVDPTAHVIANGHHADIEHHGR